MQAADIARGLKGSKKNGSGWSAHCPAHDDHSPSLTFKDGDNGMPVVKCHAGCDQLDVIKALDRMGLWPEFEKKAKPAEKAKPVLVAQYDYADPETGEIKMRVARYKPKDFRQCRPDGKGGWVWSVGAEHRILYNLPAVAKRQTIVIVEGEKDVDNLAKIDVAATCNPGGGGKWQDSYNQYLAGKNVLVLPDNDETGEKHADVVCRALNGIAASIRVVRLPGLQPKGDVSDWLEAGGTRAQLLAMYEAAPLWEPPAEPEPLPTMQASEGSVPLEPATAKPSDLEPFRCLGFNDGTYYYMSAGTQQIMALSLPQHNKAHLMGLAPLHHWETYFPAKNGADWDAATADLLQQCHDIGIFEPDIVRGRGAWYDQGRTIVHAGDRVYVDRVPHAPRDVVSKFVYQQQVPMKCEIDNPLTSAESGKFLDLLEMLSWVRPIDAKYLAGWAMIAHIGGVLDWRPHIWITGSKGSGKSYVMSQILRRVITEENSRFVVGESTEAGIRQQLGHDAIPVMFDEAEGEDTRASDRLQRIMALVRQSSSETGGKIAKGTAGGTAMTFNIRSCFAFSSINASLVQQSDRSRVTVVELTTTDRQHAFEDIVAAGDGLLTEDYGRRFYSRAIMMAPVIRANARVFAKAVAAVMDEQRAGDQLGALLAGAWALKSDDVVTLDTAKRWVATQDWAEQKAEVEEMSDEKRLYDYLRQQTIRVSSAFGMADRTIGELIDAVKIGENAGASDARKDLGRHGFKVDGTNLYISNSANAIKEMLRGTPWSVNWGKVLRRLPGAVPTDPTSFGFAGSTARAVMVPLGA